MKRYVLAAFLALSAAAATATDVGVSVHVNQPGVYGRIDIGNVPQPPVFVYPQPVIITQPAVVVERQPLYLHVPPGHAKNWRKHCRKYNACGQPVYFVREDWYQQHYVPHRAKARKEHRHDRDRHDHGRGSDRDHRDHPGKGKGQGKHKD